MTVPASGKRRAIDGVAGAALSSQVGARFVFPATRWVARRWPAQRWVRATAFHVGKALGERRNAVTSELMSGSPIVLDVRDPAQREIAFFGFYESATTSLFARLAFPGWTVVDVGANAGYYSLLARDLGGDASSIHAFEPNPTLAAMLRESIRRGDADDTITVNEVACGAAEGCAELQLSDDPSEYAFGTLKPELAWFRKGESVPVRVIALDSYCDDHGVEPDLIKMDVEGYEPEAIRGMARLLERHVPAYVICEVVTAESRPAPQLVIDAMSRYGYTAYSIEGDGSLIEAADFKQTDNVCFVAPGRPTVTSAPTVTPLSRRVPPRRGPSRSPGRSTDRRSYATK